MQSFYPSSPFRQALSECHCCLEYREYLPNNSLEIGKLVSISTGYKKEIDVYVKANRKVYFVECKAHSQKTFVTKTEAQYWIEKVSLLRKWVFENLEHPNDMEIHYDFITTSDFDDDAKQLFDNFNQKSKNYQIKYINGKQFLEFLKKENIESKDKIIKTLNEHYLKMDI